MELRAQRREINKFNTVHTAGYKRLSQVVSEAEMIRDGFRRE